MRPLRTFGFLLWLAFALAFGQQVGLQHGVVHATEKVAQKQDSRPAQVKCEQCSLVAQLTGVAATPPSIEVASLQEVLAPELVVRAAPHAVLLAYRSQAPPALL